MRTLKILPIGKIPQPIEVMSKFSMSVSEVGVVCREVVQPLGLVHHDPSPVLVFWSGLWGRWRSLLRRHQGPAAGPVLVLEEATTHVRTYAYSLLLLLRPPPSSRPQTPDQKPPPPPPSSRPQTPDPKPPRSQHAPAAPGGAGAVAGAAYSIGGTSRTCLEIRTAARTFIGEHRFICIRTYVRMYRSCSNVWLKGLASCSIH